VCIIYKIIIIVVIVITIIVITIIIIIIIIYYKYLFERINLHRALVCMCLGAWLCACVWMVSEFLCMYIYTCDRMPSTNMLRCISVYVCVCMCGVCVYVRCVCVRCVCVCAVCVCGVVCVHRSKTSIYPP